MSNLLEYFKPKRNDMVAFLQDLISLESFTPEKEYVDHLGAFLEQELKKMGASITVYPRDEVGDIRLAKWNENATGKPILLLSHIDTVWRSGTLAERPMRIEDGRLYGAGAVDMKGGITVALFAIKGMLEQGFGNSPIWYLFTTDEERGSRHSEGLIRELGAQAGLVLVTEPPNRDGSLKSWRKGVASYRLSITGRAAHAGNEPEMGVNSIIEFAQHALELNKLNDFKNGTSVSVTVVEGGSATNVIPQQTTAMIDVRTVTTTDFERVDKEVMERVPYIPGADVQIERMSHRPPMERDDATFDQAKRISEAEGITIRGEGAGGGSDGNFTAAIGVPTLDGLGAEGAGLHAIDEHVVLASLPRKAALMMALMRDWKFA
jgi:glutamate carboxypeptidase